jgi:hypothetical protein
VTQAFKRLANSLGAVSVLISLSFWFAFLPQSVPGVRVLQGVSVTVYMALWVIALLLALVPVATGSRWWIVAVILPFINILFVIAVVGIAEWMASRPN